MRTDVGGLQEQRDGQMTASKEKVTANDLRPTASEAWERMLPPSLQLEVQPVEILISAL